MKMMTAIIKPFNLDDVRDALHQLGISGMTVEHQQEDAKMCCRASTRQQHGPS